MEWHDALRRADEKRLRTAVHVLEEAIREIRELTEEWQCSVLGLMAADPKNGAFWNSFLTTCEEYHSTAFEAYKKSQTFDIEVASLPPDVDIDVALASLGRVIKSGKNPGSFFVWPFLHKSARCLFKAITADAKPLSTSERLAAAEAYFIHKDRMARFEKYWRKNLDPVSGPMADDSAPMPVADVGERIKKVRQVVQWANQHLGKIVEQAQAMGCPASRQVCHCEKDLTALSTILNGQLAVLKQNQISASLGGFEDALRRERKKADAHPLWDDFAGAVARRSAYEYEEAWKRRYLLLTVKPKAERIEALRSRLAAVVPLWAVDLIDYARKCGVTAIPTNWQTAWRIRFGRIQEKNI